MFVTDSLLGAFRTLLNLWLNYMTCECTYPVSAEKGQQEVRNHTAG